MFERFNKVKRPIAATLAAAAFAGSAAEVAKAASTKSESDEPAKPLVAHNTNPQTIGDAEAAKSQDPAKVIAKLQTESAKILRDVKSSHNTQAIPGDDPRIQSFKDTMFYMHATPNKKNPKLFDIVSLTVQKGSKIPYNMAITIGANSSKFGHVTTSEWSAGVEWSANEPNPNTTEINQHYVQLMVYDPKYKTPQGYCVNSNAYGDNPAFGKANGPFFSYDPDKVVQQFESFMGKADSIAQS